MKTLLTFHFIVLLSFFSNAQETQVITFGDDDEDYEYKANIIKTSPSAFLFGRVPFEFERELTDFLSVQVGLGLTFSSALSGLSSELLAEINDESSGNNYCNSEQWTNDYCDDLSDADIREGKLGTIISFSPRLWFDSDGMDGSYIAPLLRYSTYKNKVQKVEEGLQSILRLPDSFENESQKNFDLVVHYGYQSLNDVITWEYFVGLGIRNQTLLRQDLGFMGNRIRNGTQEEKEKKILVEMGLRVGFRL